jgi:oligoendopeptidase F
MPVRFDALPSSAEEFSAWSWEQIAPYYDDLATRPLTAANVEAWLADWTRLGALLDETSVRFTIATTTNTADEETERRYTRYLDKIVPRVMEAEQRVKQHLIESGLEPAGFAMPLRKLRTEASLFREANVPLLAELRKASLEYDKLAGARTVIWEGEERPIVQLYPVLQDPDRTRRERAWHTMRGRVLQDTPALAGIWREMTRLRRQIAANAGFDNFRSYRWQQLFRFDYTPEDAKRFHAAIEQVAVPAAVRIRERRRARMGLVKLRPWDMDVDPAGRAPLRPYQTIDELEEKTANVFRHVDPRFADYFQTMRAEKLLDLDSRKNKAGGGYSLGLNVIGRPFIFMNATGTHDDVQTLLHEGGHSFHTFEADRLPYLQQKQEDMTPMEFAEVASMGMELLGSPYLTTQYGGFYGEAEAARARTEHLEGIITFWPYMAITDALQHWIYEHEAEAADIAACDAVYRELVDRYFPDVDWSGLDDEKGTQWHSQLHVFQIPFYYIEYGLAQLGAVQVWANALRDPTAAVAAYRRALALGATVPLPDLFAAAGARFAFDAATLQSAIDLVEEQLARLEPVAAGH